MILPSGINRCAPQIESSSQGTSFGHKSPVQDVMITSSVSKAMISNSASTYFSIAFSSFPARYRLLFQRAGMPGQSRRAGKHCYFTNFVFVCQWSISASMYTHRALQPVVYRMVQAAQPFFRPRFQDAHGYSFIFKKGKPRGFPCTAFCRGDSGIAGSRPSRLLPESAADIF